MPTQDLPNGADETQTGQSAALLLVEQDDGLRRFLFWALYVEGFKVLTARDMREGLRLSRDIAGPIQVLIIGSLPSDSNRAELQKQIEAERPEARTLLLHEIAVPKTPIQLEEPRGAGASLNANVDVSILIQRIKEIFARSERR